MPRGLRCRRPGGGCGRGLRPAAAHRHGLPAPTSPVMTRGRLDDAELIQGDRLGVGRAEEVLGGDRLAERVARSPKCAACGGGAHRAAWRRDRRTGPIRRSRCVPVASCSSCAAVTSSRSVDASRVRFRRPPRQGARRGVTTGEQRSRPTVEERLSGQAQLDPRRPGPRRRRRRRPCALPSSCWLHLAGVRVVERWARSRIFIASGLPGVWRCSTR